MILFFFLKLFVNGRLQIYMAVAIPNTRNLVVPDDIIHLIPADIIEGLYLFYCIIVLGILRRGILGKIDMELGIVYYTRLSLFRDFMLTGKAPPGLWGHIVFLFDILRSVPFGNPFG